MTHIDPRIDKLVEALDECQKAFEVLRHNECRGDYYEGYATQTIPVIIEARKLASTPLKEFAGLRKDQWNTLYEYLRDREAWEEWEEEYSTACRQIADGLSE